MNENDFNQPTVVIDNNSRSWSRERTASAERRQRKKKRKRKRKACVGVLDPIAWAVFLSAIALYVTNMIASFLVALDYIGKIINFFDKKFDCFRILYRSGIFPDYAARLRKVVDPSEFREGIFSV